MCSELSIRNTYREWLWALVINLLPHVIVVEIKLLVHIIVYVIAYLAV